MFSIIAFFASSNVDAQVDYLEYIDKVKIASELAVSAKSCETLGMSIDWNGIKKILDDLIADAIRNGIDTKFATRLIQNELRKQKENENYLSNYYKNNPDRINEYVDHWANRCLRLTEHTYTKRFIKYTD